MTHRLFSRCCAAISLGVALALVAGTSVGALAASSAPLPVRCVASDHANDALAKKMAHDIAARLAGRQSRVGLKEIDSKTGVTCTLHPRLHFYAASAIKATILGALLRMAQEQHRQLTANERSLAWRMITQSDNDAATALWNEVGHRRMQHFLNLAKMTQTRLSSAWGLSLLTAHDEILLLTMLSSPNRILSRSSRRYAQYLTAHVTSSQRWGVPAGAPKGVRVHVKNGWLPYPISTNWEINSIGFFISWRPARDYEIAVLTHDNPTMAYGIDTIEDAAQVIHRDLHPGTTAAAIPESAPNPRWGHADEKTPHEV